MNDEIKGLLKKWALWQVSFGKRHNSVVIYENWNKIFFGSHKSECYSLRYFQRPPSRQQGNLPGRHKIRDTSLNISIGEAEKGDYF